MGGINTPEHAQTLQPRAREMRFEFDYEQSAIGPRWVEANAAAACIEDVRQFGGPWPELLLIQTLQIDTLLTNTIPEGREHVP